MKRILAIAVLLLAAAAVAWRLLPAEEDPNGPLVLYGNIDIRDAQLAFDELELVAEMLVEEGDRVEPGQVLARLRRSRLEAQSAQAQAQLEAQQQVVDRLVAGTRPQEIDQARAEVEAAQARLANARRNLQRLEDASASGATSQQSIDDARAGLDVARAQLDARQAALSLAVEGPRQEDIAQAKAELRAREAQATLLRSRLDDTELRAPAAGVVQSRILEPGETASPDRPAVILALTSPKWARAYVAEPDLGRLHEGMPARVRSDSFPGEPLPGWVGFISPSAEFTPKSVETTDLRTKLVYEVRVYVQDPQDRLRLGMPVTVEIDIASAAGQPGPAAPGANEPSPPETPTPPETTTRPVAPEDR